jgi:hypothetical protein
MQLHVPHVGVGSIPGQQLIVRSLFRDTAFLQDNDIVRVTNRS